LVEKPPPASDADYRARRTDIHVGKQISRRMSELGLEPTAISARINVTAGDVQLWMVGQLRPTPVQIAELAKILDVPVQYFFEP
jgi:ribosome-binding protein aMBF1 (putative translation factor)